MKPGAFKDRSIDESLKYFIEHFAVKTGSAAAKEYLDNFSKHIGSPALPATEKPLAQKKLDALKQIYTIEVVDAFRASEKGNNDLSPPSGLALTPEGNLVVSDDFNHRIQIYDKEHRLILQFGSKGKNPGELHYPKGVAADPEGNIYVADSWNHRVQKFDSQGKHLMVIGSYGSELGQMNEPYDVHIDPMRNIVVVERYNHRIQIFSAEGLSLGNVGTRGTLLEEKLANLFETPAELIASPVFEFPTAITFDSQHNAYIADSGNHRIVKFNAEWKQVCSIGTRGDGPGQFQYPMSVSSGPNDLLYVADMNNDRVQVFTSQGQFLFAFSEAGTPVQMPCLTLVDPENRLYVGLTFNTKIQVLRATRNSQETLYDREIFLQGGNFRTYFFKGKLFEESGAPDMAAKAYGEGLRLLLKNKAQHEASLSPEDMLGPIALARLRHRVPEDNTRLLEFLDLFDDRLHTLHQKIIATHAEWETSATDFGKRFVEKENLLLEHKDDPRVFDKAYYLAENKDKTLFRELRLLFCDYRKLSDLYAEFTRTLMQNLAAESDLAQCGKNLRKRLERICNLINSYIDTKEKNEESMIRFFAEAPDDRDKWQDFRAKSPANIRIIDLVKQFHYELRTLLRTFKSAVLEHPSAPWARALMEESFVSHQSAHPLLKILLRNHDFFYEMDIFLGDLINSCVIGYTGPYPDIMTTIGDLAPLAYDVENIKTEDILASMLAESMPLKKSEDGLICGNRRYKPAGCASAELAAQYDAIFKYQDVYEQKYADLFNQVISLQQQRMDLDAQLKQLDVRDKKAPIPIQKNILIVEFQASLLGRMLVTLEINESINLFRLLVCGGLVALKGTKSEQNTVFTSIRNSRANLENLFGNILKSRKDQYFEKKSAEIAVEEMNRSVNANTLEQIIAAKRQIIELDSAYGKSEAAFRRYLKTRNTLTQLCGFIDEIESSRHTQFPLSLKYSFGLGGPVEGRIFHPLGVAHTPEGNILVVEDFHRIHQFTEKGTFISEFGGWGSLFGLFKFPTSVAVDSKGCIYITDTSNRRVQKFTKDGEFILSFGDRGKPEEKFDGGISLSIDRDDKIWVVDVPNHRIQVYNSEGKHLRTMGRQGKNPEEIFEPTSILCLENGEYLVGDRSGHVLKHFNAQGKLLHALGKDGLTCDTIYYIASHPAHGIFAADSWMNRVLHLDFELKIISIHDLAGARGSQLGKVCGLSIRGNNLLVANYDTSRIHVFELPEPAK